MTKPRLLLFLDWDGTLTTQDTLAAVANIGYTHHRRNYMPDSAQLPSWEKITEAYMQDTSAHEQQYRPEAKDRRSTADELAYLASLKEVERASVQRVEAARIFQGVKRDEIDAAARGAVREKDVQLRLGWLDLLLEVHRRDSAIAIISVNWSGEFIKRCMTWSMAEHSSEDLGRDSKSTMLKRVKVYANEIEGIDADSEACGWLSKDSLQVNQEGTSGIMTSEDKVRLLEQLVDEAVTEEQTAADEHIQKSMIVYIGDSMTDLGCLVSNAVDVGICIRDEPIQSGQKKLADVLDRVGIAMRSIDEYDGLHRKTAEKVRVVWWARDFSHILGSPLMSRALEVD